MDRVQTLLLKAHDIAMGLGPAGWAAILLAVLVVQMGMLLRRLGRRSDQALMGQFAEIQTRLNMLIFETRRNHPGGPAVEEEEYTSEEVERYNVAAE